MTTSQGLPEGPFEVWLSQPQYAVTCRIVGEDERTDERDVESLSLRGAQREITGWLIGAGYVPVGRWDYTDENQRECFRLFKPA